MAETQRSILHIRRSGKKDVFLQNLSIGKLRTVALTNIILQLWEQTFLQMKRETLFLKK